MGGQVFGHLFLPKLAPRGLPRLVAARADAAYGGHSIGLHGRGEDPPPLPPSPPCCCRFYSFVPAVHPCSAPQANERLDGVETEDTITLAVQWLNLADGSLGHATYTRRVDPPCFVLWIPEAIPSSHPSVIRTSSWIAPKAEVHSQQRWFYMGQKGEVSVDQVHQDPPPLLVQLRQLQTP